jgi:hypothetical protein
MRWPADMHAIRWYVVKWRPKAEKMGQIDAAISRQRRLEHMSAERNIQNSGTVDAVFSMRFVPRWYKEKMDKNNLTMNNYCWQWLTRDRPDLSSERAPYRDKTTNFSRNYYLVVDPAVGSTLRPTDWPSAVMWLQLQPGNAAWRRVRKYPP